MSGAGASATEGGPMGLRRTDAGALSRFSP